MNIKNMEILSIDDNKTNLLIIENYAKSLSLKVDSFLNPLEALEACKHKEYDLIIIDYMMPQIDGLEFIKEFRKDNFETPIIMLTAVSDNMSLHLRALEYGANDFLNKPINSPAFKARITNLLKLKKSQQLIKNKALLLEEEVYKATNMLKDAERETLEILAKCAEYKDPETNAHTQRVAHYCKLLAKACGLDEKTQDTIFYASPFHDLGKIGIPDQILLKPAKLDNNEFDVMKQHAMIGYEILKNSKSDYLKAGGIIAYTHHEKYDGTGYPNKLKGENIHIYGRITAIVDVFDALTSNRPYKKFWEIGEAINFLIEQKGKHFDPNLVDLFIQQKDEILEIHNKFIHEE